ncbi:MAG: tRNA lysidine(34) synthetase TilS [Candidatus Cardinium sp.]|uniref:tRNA lysidine(34) synthetase TilS n=1 Tax=Cardinium endosymbiont of Dermatophagoides farinae TaxID=2597823 RepID=UPI0011828589|nr:tRNA lysidine(34) synthetase TilS [Cardinium endosymbiont of Dermatophagoides farinae]TSJ80890.1 tRNA lysidine(34) synthetase TilS [Cardinium endosymbiont of Dermatophagoides farinae]UWW96901.1 MAG: tRNA lysidine(34) synthetase TilS [Candidatus Cardinium sp.]
MLTSFLAFLARKQLITGQTTLLAVSGGVDSVVLMHLFKQAGLPFAIAHCNFKLRGAEAEAATELVKGLAESYQVPFYSTCFDTTTFTCHYKVSIQMAARSLRYEFFDKLLQQHGWHQVATAHHWDDAIETILFNFIKGTGIKGLYGIEPISPLPRGIDGQIIRPLLFARKKEIIAYAQQEKLHWQEDSSNRSNHYQRNFIRNKVIPLLHQINPNFEATTQETATKLKDIGTFFDGHLAELKKERITFKDGIHYLAIDPIIDQPWAATVAFELLRPYGFTFQAIKKLIKGDRISGKTIHSTDYTLYVDRKAWLIIPKKRPLLQQAAITSTTESYGDYRLHLHIYASANYIIKKTAMVGAFDYDRLQFPLMIRPWQAGDFFHPLGIKGRKKISDLLIDLKIPMAIKNKVLVVTSKDQIIWVVGHRIDERFKIKETTKKVLEIAAGKQDLLQIPSG